MARTRARTGIFVVAAAGALLCGCRTPLPEMEAPPPVPGDGVAVVRDAMIEAAKLADGPSRSEKAVQAVRVWRGDAEDED